MFRIGVSIGMSGNAQQFLGVLLRDMMKLNVAATMLNKNFANLKGAAIGLTVAFAGFKGLQLLWDIAKHGGELNAELNKTKQLGGEFASTIDKTRAQAFKTTFENPTSTASEVVALQRELALQMQHPAQAAALVTAASKVAYAVGNITGEKPEELIKNMVRVADELGSIFTKGPNGEETIDPAKVEATMKYMGRGLELTTGYLNSGAALQMAKQASLVSKKLSPEAFFADLFEMAVSFGGSKTGTALTSGGQQLLGGVMPQRVADADVIAGILKRSEVHHNKGGGGGVKIDPSAAKRLEQMETEPVKWMNAGGRAAVDRYMKATGSTFLVAVMRLFSRQNVQRLFAQGMWNDASFTRAREIWRMIPDPEDQQKMLMREDLNTNIKAFSASWTTLLQALGDPMVPGAIATLTTLRGVIQEMTKAASANPEAVKFYSGIFAWVSSLALVGGSIKVLGFALSAVGSGIEALLHAVIGNTLADGVLFLAKALTKLAAPITFLQMLLKSTPLNKGEEEALKQQGLAHPGVPSGPRVEKTPSERMHEFGNKLNDYGNKLLEYRPETNFSPIGYRSPSSRTTLLQDIAYRRGVEDGMGSVHPSVWPQRRNRPAPQQGPVRVEVINAVSAHVTNARDLASGTLSHISRTIDRPSAGPTWFDGKTSPYATLMGA